MEFLLESYRKHRRWVWLKQALLIASRMLAVAIAVAMLAQWISGSRWLSMMGQTTVHHYVILDDSASMGDMASNGSAYQAAMGALQSIASNATNRDGSHLLTVIRTSRASLASPKASSSETIPPTGTEKVSGDSSTKVGDQEVAGSKPGSKPNEAPRPDMIADLLSRSVPADPTALLSKIKLTVPSALDCDPSDALELIAPLLQQASNEKAIVYFERLYVAYGKFGELNAKAYWGRGQSLEELDLGREALETYEECASREELADFAEVNEAKRRIEVLKREFPPKPENPTEPAGEGSE